jgi:hypothetical protein
MRFATPTALLGLAFVGVGAASQRNGKYRSSYRSPSCSVCAATNESGCLSIMKEIVQEMKPRARLQALSTIIQSNSCYGMDDEECYAKTNSVIADLGWQRVTKTLMDDCYSGRVVLSLPSVMKFEFSSLHDQENAKHLPTALRKANSENMISHWRENCLACTSRASGVNDGDDVCADQLLSTFAALSDDDRLDVFKGVFQSLSCEDLASSDTGCLAVFDTKLSRSVGPDRKAFVFSACAKGLIANGQTPLAAASPRATVHDVPNLVSQCPACFDSETGSACTSRLHRSFASLPNNERLMTFRNGLLKSSNVERLCKLLDNDGCLEKLDRYLTMVNDSRVRKAMNGSPEELSIDTSLLVACVEGILPEAAVDPMKIARTNAYKHSSGIQTAIDDQYTAFNQSKKVTSSTKLLKADNSLCSACASLTDKSCLQTLDSAVTSLRSPELFALYKSIFGNDTEYSSCTIGSSSCFSAMQGLYETLSDKNRLSLLEEACGAGYLNSFFIGVQSRSAVKTSKANPKKDTFVNHDNDIKAAMNDWSRAMKETEKYLKLQNPDKEESAICDSCTALSDKQCLETLDSAVLLLSNPVLLIVYKSIFRKEASTCMTGHTDADAQCLKALQVLFDVLSDKDRLSGLRDACSYGFFDTDFVAPDVSTNDVIYMSRFVQPMNFATAYATAVNPSTNAAYYMFGISAALALTLGFIVSHLVRKKRSKNSKFHDQYRLGPIHEYTALDG